MIRPLISTCVPLISTCVIAFSVWMSDAPPAVAGPWRWVQEPDQSVALTRDGETVWQFHYGSAEPKPHFHPVALAGGAVVTWNRPPDHIWHHGLWFSWKYINGLNYWEPSADGIPEGATEWKDVRVETTEQGSAELQMELTYRPRGKAAVMTEQRRISVSSPDARGAYHFDWDCRFTALDADVVLDRTPLPDEPAGKAWGGYAGLSLRLAQPLTDRRAVTDAGPVTFNDQQRFRGKARAMDYQGRIGDQLLGIAVLDHPENLNHPTPWYAIRAQPMSYFSPAVICYGPHTLKRGASFTLRYRVVVHDGRWTADRLENAWKEYADEG
jgi:hypothetical protein